MTAQSPILTRVDGCLDAVDPLALILTDGLDDRSILKTPFANLTATIAT